MARRATSLGPKPSLSVFCFYSVFFVFCFGGFKGQVRWPKGPPHLALNPPYLFVVLSFFSFPIFVSNTKKPCFPPRKGHFLFIFECLPLFLLSLFWPPPFSIFLSLSLSFFLLVFLPSCLSFCFLLLPCFCLFNSFSFFFAFVSWKEQHQNIQLQSFLASIFSLFFSGFLSCFLFEISFSYLCILLDFKLWFWFNINVFGFKKHKLKNTNFCSKGGLQQNVFFMNLCFAKCESYRFFGPFFWLILVDVQKAL